MKKEYSFKISPEERSTMNKLLAMILASDEGYEFTTDLCKVTKTAKNTFRIESLVTEEKFFSNFNLPEEK